MSIDSENNKLDTLERVIQPMPEFVKEALLQENVMDEYINRPAYQKNDYLGWINRAKRESTKIKRLDQMIDELKQGGIYMKMDHPASSKD